MKSVIAKRIVVLVLAIALLIGSVFLIRSCSAPPDYSEIDARFQELIEKAYDVNVILFGEGLPIFEHVSDPKSSTNVIRTGEYVTDKNGEQKERMIYYYYTLDKENTVLAYRDSYLEDFAYALLASKPMDAEALAAKFPRAEGDDGEYYALIYEDAAKKQYCYTVPYTEVRYDYYYTSADDATYDYVRLDSGYIEIADIKAKVEEVYSDEYSRSIYGSVFDGEASGDVVMTPKFIETTASNGSMMLAQSNTYGALKVEKRVYLFETATINKFSSNKNLVRISVDTYLPSNPDKILTKEITLVYEDGNWYLNNPSF